MSIPGHAMGGGGWASMRSLRRDRSLLQHRVQKGTARRMMTFAVPYRKILALFLPVVVLGAVIGAINPLILRALIDNGIAKHNADLVIGLAVLAGVLALLDAGLSLTERRISAVIGEGLIFDMRSKVFRHIQSMPLAFFTRTQTGALISRLNNDVLGAQQAFTDLLSNAVGNLVTVLIVLGAMFYLSWQITLASLILLPIFLIPARIIGRHIGSLTHEGYNLNSEMNMVMQERFNVGGAMLVKLLGRPKMEAESFDAKAGRVRDIGVLQATYSRVFLVALTLTAALATAIVYGFGGVAAVRGTLEVGTVVALAQYLTRLYGPLTQLSNLQLDVVTALISFERLFEVLDIVPMITEAPDAVDIPRGSVSIELEDVDFTYPSAEEVSLASLESVAVLETGLRTRDSPRGLVPSRSGPDGGPGRAVGCGQDHHLVADPPPLRRHRGLAEVERCRCAPRHDAVHPRRGGSGDPGPLHVPRLAASQPAVRPPGGHRGGGPRRPGAGPDRPSGGRAP